MDCSVRVLHTDIFKMISEIDLHSNSVLEAEALSRNQKAEQKEDSHRYRLHYQRNKLLTEIALR